MNSETKLQEIKRVSTKQQHADLGSKQQPGRAGQSAAGEEEYKCDLGI